MGTRRYRAGLGLSVEQAVRLLKKELESVTEDEGLSMVLLDRLRAVAPPGTVVLTLANDQPNWVVDVSSDGVRLETGRSRRMGSGPQLVPGWMIQRAWDHLASHGSLTNSELLDTQGLNVKRSSAVCALLARLPEIEVVKRRPITLALQLGGPSDR